MNQGELIGELERYQFRGHGRIDARVTHGKAYLAKAMLIDQLRQSAAAKILEEFVDIKVMAYYVDGDIDVVVLPFDKMLDLIQRCALSYGRTIEVYKRSDEVTLAPRFQP